jgi:hypothetical protein
MHIYKHLLVYCFIIIEYYLIKHKPEQDQECRPYSGKRGELVLFIKKYHKLILLILLPHSFEESFY